MNSTQLQKVSFVKCVEDRNTYVLQVRFDRIENYTYTKLLTSNFINAVLS